MSRKFIFICFALLNIVWLQQNFLVNSQTQSLNIETQSFNNLTLEISSPSQLVLPLQPIPLHIKQTNRTNQATFGYRSLGFKGFPIYLYTRKAGDTERRLVYPLTTMSGLSFVKNTSISPNSGSETKEWIALRLNEYFSESGNYELQVVLANDDRTQFIESNTLSIEVKEPSGIDKNAYNFIKNSSFAASLFSDIEFDKKKNTLETLSTVYKNTPYSKSADYVIGSRYFNRKQYLQALPYLLKLESDNNFIFAEKVKDYLTEIRRLPPEQTENK